MARKKKKKSLDGVALESMQYRGFVEVTATQGNLVRKLSSHNQGSEALSAFFRDCLLGLANVDQLPRQIFICTGNMSDDEPERYLNGKAFPLSSASRKTLTLNGSTKSYAMFEFKIKASSIQGGQQISGFILADGQERELARVAINTTLNAGTALDIKWALRVDTMPEEV